MKVEKKMKREASYEFFPWDRVDYKDQIEEYFKIVRKPNNQGLNPRLSIPTSIVSNANIAEVFGSLYNGFKTTNLHLHHDKEKVD